MTEDSPLTFPDQTHFQGRLVISILEKLEKLIFMSGPWWFGCPKTKPLLEDGDNSVDMLTSLQFDYSEAEDVQNDLSSGAGDEDLDVDTNY